MHLNPLAWDYQTWRFFFAIAALWNLIGALDGIARPARSMVKYYGVETDDYYTLFLCRSFWLAVLVFGIGYGLIAYSPASYTGIVIMGIIGKILVSINWFYLAATGRATAIAMLAACGDSAFTVFFAFYLYGGAGG